MNNSAWIFSIIFTQQREGTQFLTVNKTMRKLNNTKWLLSVMAILRANDKEFVPCWISHDKWLKWICFLHLFIRFEAKTSSSEPWLKWREKPIIVACLLPILSYLVTKGRRLLTVMDITREMNISSRLFSSIVSLRCLKTDVTLRSKWHDTWITLVSFLQIPLYFVANTSRWYFDRNHMTNERFI
jgi:hypothetical protein